MKEAGFYLNYCSLALGRRAARLYINSPRKLSLLLYIGLQAKENHCELICSTPAAIVRLIIIQRDFIALALCSNEIEEMTFIELESREMLIYRIVLFLIIVINNL